jgi:hypothetical protein
MATVVDRDDVPTVRWTDVVRSVPVGRVRIGVLVGVLVGCSATPVDPVTGPVAESTPAVEPAVEQAVEPVVEHVVEPVVDLAVESSSPVGSLPGPTDVGVPGLDSSDGFCAAWSRFGGSWQVLQVAAVFGPEPDRVSTLEVIAAPVVIVAFDGVFDAWPSELASERDIVRTEYFGAFRRRADVALGALLDAGATDEDLAVIARAWEEALAGRRPDEPVPTVVLDGEVAGIVRDAAVGFGERIPGLAEDPSMFITAATPLTDAHLASACPDQGALVGGEVGPD